MEVLDRTSHDVKHGARRHGRSATEIMPIIVAHRVPVFYRFACLPLVKMM